jgi:hypothetical protein
MHTLVLQQHHLYQQIFLAAMKNKRIWNDRCDDLTIICICDENSFRTDFK